MTKSDLIREALLRRYPCQALPTGALTDIGNEFGTSRELVRQVATKIGIKTPGPGGRRAHPLMACGGCGKAITLKNQTGICQTCRWIEIPCAECGTTVRRRAAAIASQFSEKRQQYRSERGFPLAQTSNVFCNRKCLGKYQAARYGWGSGHGKNQPAKKQEASK